MGQEQSQEKKLPPNRVSKAINSKILSNNGQGQSNRAIYQYSYNEYHQDQHNSPQQTQEILKEANIVYSNYQSLPRGSSKQEKRASLPEILIQEEICLDQREPGRLQQQLIQVQEVTQINPQSLSPTSQPFTPSKINEIIANQTSYQSRPQSPANVAISEQGQSSMKKIGNYESKNQVSQSLETAQFSSISKSQRQGLKDQTNTILQKRLQGNTSPKSRAPLQSPTQKLCRPKKEQFQFKSQSKVISSKKTFIK